MRTGPASPSASVISTDHTQTILSKDTMGAVLHALRGGAFPANGTVQERFSLTATAGYRITGMRLSASVTGAFEVGQPPAGATDVRYGDAGNRKGVWFGTSDFKPVKAYDKSRLTQTSSTSCCPSPVPPRLSPCTAYAVNNAGLVRVTYSKANEASFGSYVWSDSGGKVDLGSLGGGYSHAFVIRADGTTEYYVDLSRISHIDADGRIYGLDRSGVGVIVENGVTTSSRY